MRWGLGACEYVTLKGRDFKHILVQNMGLLQLGDTFHVLVRVFSWVFSGNFSFESCQEKKKKALDLVKFCNTHGNKREKGKERLGKTIGLADKTCLVFRISSVFINFFFCLVFSDYL